MAVELAIRLRCGHCGLALEFLAILRPPQLPFRVDGIELPNLPPGWGFTDKGDLHCAAHEPKRIVVPTPDLARFNGGRGQ